MTEVEALSLELTVYGVPVPKGSMKAFVPRGWTRPIVTHDNAKTRPWQEAIVCAARDAMGARPPVKEPVALTLRFYLPRPASAPRRVTVPAKKPDLDKLVRCVADGLTRAGVYRDDGQVVETSATKHFAGGSADPEGTAGVPRVEVHVWPLVAAVLAGHPNFLGERLLQLDFAALQSWVNLTRGGAE